ncbi:MAG: hypothetical protein IKU07_05280 [Oscillospiraceae bacterium]|nr:hypothetical protein [Oscillospiraceae bacterium]
MEKLLAGYARTDITPTESVPLAGYGNTMKRMSQGVLDPMAATCIALTAPDGNTVLLFTLDIIYPHDTYAPEARRAISCRWGIPTEAVIIAGTHTHSGPDMDRLECPAVANYKAALVEKLTELAGAALSDRKPCHMECGKAYNEKMNYIRHYVLENGDICGDNFGDPSVSPYRGHVAEPDREIRIVKFCREGGKDILLTNWQAHPSMASTIATEHGRAGRPYISSDYIGACRDYVEQQSGMHFAFFLGAAGNINSRSRLEWEQDTRDHREYGKLLGDYILAGAENLQPMAATKIGYTEATLEAPLNHTEDHLVPQAAVIYEEWLKTNDYRHCAALAVPHGIHSPYHAGGILTKAKLGQSSPVTMGACRVGDLGIGVFPCEMFDTNGIYVRENSGYPMTLIFSCANGRQSYFPSKAAFAHGCYEADMCKYAPGIGEATAELGVAMLKKLREEA